jgi:hypothetical protein
MKHAQTIEDCISEYNRSKPYRKIRNSNGTTTLKITKKPPVEIQIVAGEIIYHLRSALDHIFFDLVERHHPTGIVPTEIEDKLMFPLCLNPPGDAHKTPPIPRKSFGTIIPQWLPEKAFALIESLQPYYRRHDDMRMLRIFSNIDKHRRLNTIGVRMSRIHTLKHRSGLSSTVLMSMLQDGAELHTPVHPELPRGKRKVKVEDKYVVTVAFDEPEFGPFQTAPMDNLIYGLPPFIFNVSLHFKKFLK